MSKSYDNLREDFIFNRDEKEYRHGYGEESLDISIGTQIKVLREQRGWRQEDLAREAAMQQPMVSRYENINYSNWSIRTLKKLARAYDVWLDVRFRSFGDLVDETNHFSRESLQVPSFADDPFFKIKHRVSRPKIRARPQPQRRVISFATREPIMSPSFSIPATEGPLQLPLQWDLPLGSKVGPQLVNSELQQQQENSSVRDISMQATATSIGAGRDYARQVNG
jgi:transcriptional regulator with XRE-family HTH domain